MVKLLSTLPAQVLEPLCGPRHSRSLIGDCSCSASAGRDLAALSRVDRRRRRPHRRRPSAPASQPAAGAHRTGFDAARATLQRLPVKGWDRVTDFSRYRFGEAWSDDVNVEFGHNGCNTRDDILRRDLADLVVRPGTCYAQSGVLHDPYTGAVDRLRPRAGHLRRRADRPLVSLSDAWYKGAREWDDQRRRDFANDPRNLLAVGAKSQLRQGFSRCRQLGCRPTRRSAASSSPGRST